MPLEKLTATWAQTQQIRRSHEHTVNNTFEEAKDNFLLDQDSSLTLYTATHQTKGRGRGDKDWQDTSGGSFLATFSFKVTQPPQPVTPPLVGLALYKSIGEVWKKAQLSLKAPNDILLDGKKVAGILIENIQQGSALRCLVGIGINVLDHPSEAPEATSLKEELGDDLELEQRWPFFLDSLKWNLEQAMVDGVLQLLSTRLRQELLEALNKNPHQKAPYTDVLADGSLKRGEEITPWMTI